MSRGTLSIIHSSIHPTKAHEGQVEEHVWYVDLCFFLGFMSAFLLEKLS